MEFKPVPARVDWKQRAQQLGYMAALFDDPPYWVEALPEPFCATFTASEIEDIIEPATRELSALALLAVEEVCSGVNSEDLFTKLQIPPIFRDPIRESWNRRDHSIYGRFDYSYNDGKLKLLEMNFDTAISLYEASIFQLVWLEDLRAQGQIDASSDQFNVIHETLLKTFATLDDGGKQIHFTSVKDAEEDEDTTKYLMSCAMLAGLNTKFLHMHELGYDERGQLIDTDGHVITHLFKLYPWEYLFEDDNQIVKNNGQSILAPLIESGGTAFIEPIWKTILANKGILPILWEMAPECPYLLETYFENDGQAAALKNKPHVKKPLCGREGGSISIVYPGEPEKSIVNPGVYGKEGFVVQALHPLPKHGDYHVLLGSWVIAGNACGIGIRADLSPITTGMHCLFVPHLIEA